MGLDEKFTYIWYASYGSNMRESRFLCYIQGGAAEGATIPEPGCRDQSLPLEKRTITIPHPLYFTGNSDRWGGGGIAFIGHNKERERPTQGVMYKITGEQFMDVVYQENLTAQQFPISFEDTIRSGLQQVFSGRYGTMMYLGQEEDVPIFTFTANQDGTDEDYRAPSKRYLTTLFRGLYEHYGWDINQMVSYMIDKSGVSEGWDEARLRQLYQEVCK